MDKKIAFTIVSKNYLGQALTSYSYFKEIDSSGFEYRIYLMDASACPEESEQILSLIEKGAPIYFWTEMTASFPEVDFESMVKRYNVMEMNTAIKPYVIDHLYKRGASKVVYFDPDIAFYGSLRELDELLDQYSLVLTPHTLTPYPEDGKETSNITLNKAGIYNLGFLGTSSSQETLDVCKFWEQCLFDKAFARPESGMFTDQKWADFFPAICSNHLILRKKGYNVAYWNLHERTLTKSKNGRLLVNGDPLIFFHFSGLNPRNTEQISKHQTRFVLSQFDSFLKDFFEEYACRLLQNEYVKYQKLKYYYKTHAWENSHLTISGNQLYDYSIRLIAYVKENNPRLFLYLRDLGKSLVPNWKSKLLALNNKFTPIKYSETKENTDVPSYGINIYGYFEEPHSIGHAARKLAEKAIFSGVPVSLVNIGGSSDGYQYYKRYYLKNTNNFINIFVANLDQIPYVVKQKVVNKSKVYAYPFWEYESGLEKYKDSFSYLDGVVTCSKFIKETIEKFAPDNFEVTHLDYPFTYEPIQNEHKKTARERYGIDLNAYVFFFNFDYNSSFDRKNPTDILKAFERAFQESDRVQLVFKTSKSEYNNLRRKEFQQLCDQSYLNKKIIIIDKYLDRSEFNELMSCCDAYISLHHGEGYGLGMLEAMSYGMPTIATNYSGNTEFCNKKNCYLVPVQLVRCQDRHPAYNDVKFWAQPNVDVASKYMKELVSNPERGRLLGQVSQEFVKEKYDISKFSRQLTDLLQDNMT